MILELIKSGDFSTRCRCLGILRKLENPSNEVLDTLLEVVSEDEIGNAYRAGFVLSYFPDRADYIVPRLVAMLDKRNPNLEAVVIALDCIGPVARDTALPALESIDTKVPELSGIVEKALNSMYEHHKPISEESDEVQANLFVPDPTVFPSQAELHKLADRVSLRTIKTIAADYQINYGKGKSIDLMKIDRAFVTETYLNYSAKLRLDRQTGNGYVSGRDTFPFQRARNGKVGKSLFYFDDEDRYQATLFSPEGLSIKGQFEGYDKRVTNLFHNDRTLEDVLRNLGRDHFQDQRSPRIWFRVVEDSDSLFRFDIIDHHTVKKEGDEIPEEDRASGVSVTYTPNKDRFQVTLDKTLNWAMTELVQYSCHYNEMGLEYSPGKIRSRIIFSDHVLFGDIWLPKNVRSFSSYDDETLVRELAVSYLSVNKPDDMIDSFDFPKGVSVSDERKDPPVDEPTTETAKHELHIDGFEFGTDAEGE